MKVATRAHEATSEGSRYCTEKRASGASHLKAKMQVEEIKVNLSILEASMLLDIVSMPSVCQIGSGGLTITTDNEWDGADDEVATIKGCAVLDGHKVRVGESARNTNQDRELNP